jgi:hypothetical protein
VHEPKNGKSVTPLGPGEQPPVPAAAARAPAERS